MLLPACVDIFRRQPVSQHLIHRRPFAVNKPYHQDSFRRRYGLPVWQRSADGLAKLIDSLRHIFLLIGRGFSAYEECGRLAMGQ